jgi:two-component system sensor histidine kinase RpfC
VRTALAIAGLAGAAVLLVRDGGDFRLWEGLVLGLLAAASVLALRSLRVPRRGLAGGDPSSTPGQASEASPAPARPAEAAARPAIPGSDVASAVEASRARGVARPSAPGTPARPGVLILAGSALGSELAAAAEGWGLRAERVPGTSRAFAELVLAAERNSPYRAALVDRARLLVSPAEFVAAVREEPCLRGLRLVLIDASGDRASEADLRRAGYAAVLGIPLDKTLLFTALRGEPSTGSSPGNAVSLAAYYRQRARGRPRRVLVADDNPVTRNALKAILEGAEYEVQTASDGEETLDLLERGRPPVDVVILDVQMPGRSGLDVLRALRYMQPDARVPVVMLTGERCADLRESCLRAGADAFLLKPVDPQRLLLTLAGLETPRVQLDRPSAGGPPPRPEDRALPARVRLDDAVLEALQRLGREPGFLKALVDGFLREGGQTLRRIEAAVAAGDRAAFVDGVQALRGAAGDIGAREVAGLCERLAELPPDSLQSSRMSLLLEALVRTFEATAVALTEYVERARNAAR